MQVWKLTLVLLATASLSQSKLTLEALESLVANHRRYDADVPEADAAQPASLREVISGYVSAHRVAGDGRDLTGIIEITAFKFGSKSITFERENTAKIIEILGKSFPVPPTASEIRKLVEELNSMTQSLTKELSTSSLEVDTQQEMKLAHYLLFAFLNKEGRIELATHGASRNAKYLDEVHTVTEIVCHRVFLLFEKCEKVQKTVRTPRKVDQDLKRPVAISLRRQLLDDLVSEHLK